MLETTRASFGFRDRPVTSLRRLATSRLRRRSLQVVRLPGGVVLHADTGHPNRCYAWTGERSWNVASVLAALLRPGDVFLDVGAFTGQHTMRAARLVGASGRVVAVEPDPRALPWLRRNLRAAGLEDTVEVMEAAAVPDARAHAELDVAAPLSAAAVSSRQGHGTARVPAVDIGALVRDLRPDVVKIDVEGLDAALVARVCQAVARPPVMVVEANPGVAEAAAAGGLQAVPTGALLAPSDASLINVSPDLVVFPPGRLGVADFAERVTAEAARLRVLPRVSFRPGAVTVPQSGTGAPGTAQPRTARLG